MLCGLMTSVRKISNVSAWFLHGFLLAALAGCGSDAERPAGSPAAGSSPADSSSEDVLTELEPADATPPGSESEEQGERSLLVYPSYLGQAPPEARAVAQIRLVWAGAPGVSVSVKRSVEETRLLAAQLIEQLAAGADFGELARRYSADKSATFGGVWGSVTPGVFGPELDAWLFQAELGEFSEPIELASGLLILKRIDRLAACRTLQVNGTDAEALARCEQLAARVAAGESFAAVARESSADPISRARGGALAIFERGRTDTLLKGAAFELPVGAVSAPIRSSIGWHLVQRVPLDELDPVLRETTFVRARALLLQYTGAVGAQHEARWNEDVELEIRALHERILAGEDMAGLARELSEDPASAVRGGDLGWLHRGSPQIPHFMAPLFHAEVGELLHPLDTTAGWLILRREQ